MNTQPKPSAGAMTAADMIMRSQPAGGYHIIDSNARKIAEIIDRETALSAARSAGFEGAHSHGDTTGCGDAFAGGLIASIAVQLLRGGNRPLDLAEAVGWGIAGGAFTLSILGGTYFESCPGDKRAVVEAIHGKLPRQAALPFKDSEHA